MRHTGEAVKREVRVVFEPDRLARESLERAYARLAPVPLRRGQPPIQPAAPRGAGTPSTSGGKP